MSAKIDPLKGTWVWDHIEDQSSFPKTSTSSASFKRQCVIISGIAFLAIGALAAGGALLYFKVNTIAAWSLIGGGGVLVIGDLIGAALIYASKPQQKQLETDAQKKTENTDIKEKIEGSYRIVSWNVGTQRDYSNMCFLKNKIKEGSTFEEAYRDCLNTDYWATSEEKEDRTKIFQKAFQQFERPDIICLQESYEIKPEDLPTILPQGYSFFSYENFDGRDCTIVWNSAKFTKLAHADLSYDPESIPARNAAPDTIILLKDHVTATKICVGSAHLRGFSLAFGSFETAEKLKEIGKAGAGDNQTNYDLATMEQVQADLYIFAGDFNVTDKHYPSRLGIIRNHGYISDFDESPTIYDANLKKADGSPLPVRLDYIFVKGRKNAQVQINYDPLKRTELSEFENRASDHLPTGSKIEFSVV